MASSDTSKEEEFKAGLVRSMKQYNAGLAKTFDNVDDLLADLCEGCTNGPRDTLCADA